MTGSEHEWPILDLNSNVLAVKIKVSAVLLHFEARDGRVPDGKSDDPSGRGSLSGRHRGARSKADRSDRSNPLELIAIAAVAFRVNVIAQDGETTWFEELLLLAVHALLALAFFFVTRLLHLRPSLFVAPYDCGALWHGSCGTFILRRSGGPFTWLRKRPGNRTPSTAS